VLLLEFDRDVEDVVAGVIEDLADWGEVASVEVWLTVISAVKDYLD
jgi:hypothetical protein